MMIIWNTRIIKRVILLIIICVTILLLIYNVFSNQNITSYKYSFKKASLTYRKRQFYLKDERFQILSGSIHYFRVPPDLWRDRLRFLKSTGMNTVETYCPWNLHEEHKGLFNFDGILNLRKFVQEAHELGLFVILRPGPYVCAELEFGGLPSWLLTDPNMKVRSTYVGFKIPVQEFLRQLVHEVDDLQHSNGGPIIAFQLENEYGSFGNSLSYMQSMKEIYIESGVVESLFISNSIQGISNQKKIDGIFYGINSNKMADIEKAITVINSIDPELPIFITEFWTGWFQTWNAPRSKGLSDNEFKSIMEYILKQGFSVNLYMFHGGTNFGFINGANNITKTPEYVTTSYDYNAPLKEDGRPNNKYFIIRKTVLGHLANDPNFQIADIPEKEMLVKYDDVDMSHVLELKSLLDLVDNSVISRTLKTMEEMPINGNSGQSFGFILYRTEVKPFTSMQILGQVRDRALVLYNYEPLTNYWRSSVVSHKGHTQLLLNNVTKLRANGSSNYLDIIVENMGRYNFALFQTEDFNEQRKGIQGNVLVDNSQVNSWKIYPLEFKKSFMNKVSGSQKWQNFKMTLSERPQMYRGTFIINEKPSSTHIVLSGWTKGVVFVNGVNIGRYWNVGPTESLFLPKSYLRVGENEIILFELHAAGRIVSFQSHPVFLDSELHMFN